MLLDRGEGRNRYDIVVDGAKLICAFNAESVTFPKYDQCVGVGCEVEVTGRVMKQ